MSTRPGRYQVSVILTDECNMRCTYCTTAKRPVWITAEHIDRILALLGTDPRAPLDVNFHGGEPTIAWPMVEYLAAGLERLRSARRLSLNMCTNGTGIDRKRAVFLAAHRFDVRVSVDGRRASHTLFRHPRPHRQPGPDAGALFAATMRGLEHLREAGVKVAANMVVTPDTVGELLRNAVYLVRRGLVHLVVSPVVGMPWQDQHLLELDRQLRGLLPLWRRWMSLRPAREHEDLRRSILSEIDRATYCIGERMNQPEARVLVFGPDGRIFGDEPDARTEKALVIGHISECRDIAGLPCPPRTAFQLMYDRAFYPRHVLRDVRRTHRLLRNRMSELYARLFGELPTGTRSPPVRPHPGSTSR